MQRVTPNDHGADCARVPEHEGKRRLNVFIPNVAKLQGGSVPQPHREPLQQVGRCLDHTQDELDGIADSPEHQTSCSPVPI